MNLYNLVANKKKGTVKKDASRKEGNKKAETKKCPTMGRRWPIPQPSQPPDGYLLTCHPIFPCTCPSLMAFNMTALE
jgi:hypothetical protein